MSAGIQVLGNVTPKPIIINGTYVNPELGKYHARLRTIARSCLDIKEKYGASQSKCKPSHIMDLMVRMGFVLFLIKARMVSVGLYWLCWCEPILLKHDPKTHKADVNRTGLNGKQMMVHNVNHSPL